MVARGRSDQGEYLYWSALITLPREGLKKTGPKITGTLVIMHGKVKRNGHRTFAVARPCATVHDRVITVQSEIITVHIV